MAGVFSITKKHNDCNFSFFSRTFGRCLPLCFDWAPSVDLLFFGYYNQLAVLGKRREGGFFRLWHVDTLSIQSKRGKPAARLLISSQVWHPLLLLLLLLCKSCPAVWGLHATMSFCLFFTWSRGGCNRLSELLEQKKKRRKTSSVVDCVVTASVVC